MENIQTFVNFCEAYGVTKTGLFQTVDLYDGRNMSLVISCIQQLGSEVSICNVSLRSVHSVLELAVLCI